MGGSDSEEDAGSRGRSLTPLELRYLRLLLDARKHAHSLTSFYDERLEDFVLECREDGATVRGMAEQLGVGASTIHTWTTHARRRRSAR